MAYDDLYDTEYGPERDRVQNSALPALRVQDAREAARAAADELGIDSAAAGKIFDAGLKVLQAGAYRPGLNLCPICSRLLLDGKTCERHGGVLTVKLLVAFPPLDVDRFASPARPRG